MFQSDVVHQSVFELIHTDDRALFRRQLHFALKPNSSQSESGADSPSESPEETRPHRLPRHVPNDVNIMFTGENSAEITTGVMNYDPQAIPPENSSFLERNFCCRFRCLLDNSSGFLVTAAVHHVDARTSPSCPLFVCKRVSCPSSGPELPRPPEVPPRSEPADGERDAGSPAARPVRHRHAAAAAVHPGDPHQDAHVPDQAQAGLHAHGHRHQVHTHRHTLTHKQTI